MPPTRSPPTLPAPCRRQKLACQLGPRLAKSSYVGRCSLLTQCNGDCQSIRLTRLGCGVRHGARTAGYPRPRPSTCAATRKRRNPSWTARAARFQSGLSWTTKLRRWPSACASNRPRPTPRTAFRTTSCRMVELVRRSIHLRYHLSLQDRCK